MTDDAIGRSRGKSVLKTGVILRRLILGVERMLDFGTYTNIYLLLLLLVCLFVCNLAILLLY